jgi:hypothetical protein
LANSRNSINSTNVSTSIEWMNSLPVEEHTFNQAILLNKN